MKKTILLLSLLLTIARAGAQEGHPVQPSSNREQAPAFTAIDWQNDLRFLQQTVHKDYPFLFKKVKPADFDAAVEKLYKEMPSLQDHQRMAGLARIVSLFKYGHTDIGWRQGPVKYMVAPINFYWFSDGLFVEGVAPELAALAGAKLLKVEGMPVEKALEAIKPLVPVENEQYFKGYGLDFLVIPEALHAQGVTNKLKKTVTYTFQKENKTFEQTIAAREAFRQPRTYGFVSPSSDWVSLRDKSTTPYYLKHIDKKYYFEYLPASKTVYVRQSQVLDEEKEPIADFYKKVFDFIDKNEVEKLVLDFRLNGGGNNYKNKPVITGILENKKINQPGKLFAIIGRRTFSACQNMVNELSNYTNAIFVGEPTAENINFYGDNRRVVLPKTGIPVFLSFAWWQDKPQWENDDWLAPHLSVEMSSEQYRGNQDPVLDACLNFSGKDLIRDPVGHLRELFLAGKLDQVETEAKRMVADPLYRYVKFEAKINESGYNLLGNNQVENALYVFALNTKLFPNSANAWDSYAEANWKAKKTDKAIEYYNKAIALDPNGETGANARQKLLEIEKEKKGF